MRLHPKLVAQALALVGVAGLLALLVWKVVHEEGGIASQVAAGKHPAAPAFSLPPLHGDGRVSLAAYRGRPVVINFWQSTCEPCKQEAGAFQRAWERFRRERVVFVGLDFWDLRSDARSFVRRHGITYPQAYDGPGTTLAPYGVTGAPETFFVDRRGKVVAHSVGELSSGELTEQVEGLLNE